MSTTPTLANATTGGPALGYPGDLADASPHVVDTYQNESATAVDFAVPVAPGTLAGSVKPIANDTDAALCVGIAMRDPTMMSADPSTNVANYARYRTLGVMRQGRIFAIAAENVTDGDQVLIITGSSAAQAQATAFGSSHGAGGAAAAGRIALLGAIWRAHPIGASKSITSGSVAVIEMTQQYLGVTTT
jgi:hypothetical protein